MSDKYLTVLVVPHDERNVRRWRVSYRWVRIGLGVGVALLVLATVAVGTYGWVASRASRAALLERENERLSEENAKVGEIAANLERTERAYEQIREMAGLPPAERTAPTGAREERGPLARNEDGMEPAPRPASAAPDTVPSGWPLSLKGFESARFSGSEGHPGVDIAVPVHTPVLATAAGRVRVAGSDPVYGHYIVLDHGGRVETMYGHNAVLLVEAGERVTRGQTIAYSGNSGRSTAPHLHYEIREDGEPVDPAPFLR